MVTPLLPGESLLLTSGTLAGTEILNIGVLAPLLFAAAFSATSATTSSAASSAATAEQAAPLPRPSTSSRRRSSTSVTGGWRSCWRDSCRSCGRWRPSASAWRSTFLRRWPRPSGWVFLGAGYWFGTAQWVRTTLPWPGRHVVASLLGLSLWRCIVSPPRHASADAAAAAAGYSPRIGLSDSVARRGKVARCAGGLRGKPRGRSVSVKVQRALISVFNKSGVESFAKGLTDLGVQVVSTGGTARLLKDSGIPVTLVEEVTGFPEMLDGRVKTMHPTPHGRHPRAIATCPSTWRPSRSTTSSPSTWSSAASTRSRRSPGGAASSDEVVIENIDIGGPTMIRAAAKNHAGVAVVTSHDDYDALLEELRDSGGELSLDTLREPRHEGFSPHGPLRLRDRQLVQRGRGRLPRLRHARLREDPRAEVRREPAPARRLLRRGRACASTCSRRSRSCTASSSASTTSTTSTRRAASATSSRCPASPSSSTTTRAAAPSRRTWRRPTTRLSPAIP